MLRVICVFDLLKYIGTSYIKVIAGISYNIQSITGISTYRFIGSSTVNEKHSICDGINDAIYVAHNDLRVGSTSVKNLFSSTQLLFKSVGRDRYL